MLFDTITLLNYGRPMRERLEARKHVGPYKWTPSEPGKGRGFYQASKGLYMDPRGSTLDLRLEDANDHLDGSSLARTSGYYCDRFQDETAKPIIARLPKGRGFLAGYTMGPGMCAGLTCTVWDTIEEAARAAHGEAEAFAELRREGDEEDDLEGEVA